MLDRFGQLREVVPRLRHSLSHAALRRMMDRLRSGEVHSADPRIPSHVLAGLLEGSIAQDALTRSVVADMHGLRELEQRLKKRSR